MVLGRVVVVLLRLLVPLMIPRFPLAGGILSMLLDGADVILVDIISPDMGFGGSYAEIDKGLDTYYLAIELLVALRWKSAYARMPAIVLFVYRTIGVIAFEVTSERVLLFAFPNLFENWWLFCVAAAAFWPAVYPRSWRQVAAIGVILLIPKMGQEYLLHYAEAKPWEWAKQHLLNW